MKTRMQLHEELCAFLGSRNVYFQPPETVKMKYPCIVYNISPGDTRFADNRLYAYTQAYELTLIYKDPDSLLFRDLLMSFPLIRHNRHYIADNLNHDNFTLYY